MVRWAENSEREEGREGRKEGPRSLNLEQAQNQPSEQSRGTIGMFEWPEKMLSFSRTIPFCN